MSQNLEPQKPPYRVPPMAEIEATPLNGFKVISSFSGCGGSCLGLRMAGFETVWANEFVPAARAVYRLNHPGVFLDGRDVRRVTPQHIFDATGLGPGEADVIEGSPPCSAFSSAGKRQAGWNQVRKYSDTRQRVDDLFFEFARLLEGVRPKVFMAENVSGLVKGVAKGYFKEILARLKGCGYLVEARLLDAQWLGVPQMRQRLFFVGVRDDLAARGFAPAFPCPLPYRYSVREAIPWVFRQGDNGGFGGGGMREATGPSPTIGAGPQTGNGAFPPSLVEARVIHDTSGTHSQGDVTDRPCPAITVGVHSLNANDYKVVGDGPPQAGYAIGREWDGLDPGAKSGKYINLVRPDPERSCPTVTAQGGRESAASVTHPVERRKFTILELKRICAFPDDFRLTGTYAQQWERLGRSVPPLMAFAVAREIRDRILLPVHRGV